MQMLGESQFTAEILSVIPCGATGSLVFRHGHQLTCLMKVEET